MIGGGDGERKCDVEFVDGGEKGKECDWMIK